MNIKSKITISLLLIFLIGVITGIMWTRIVSRNMLANALDRPFILERLEARLGNLSLSPEQDQKIQQILLESRDKGQNLRNQFQTVLMEIRRKINNELTAEQRSQFRREVNDGFPLLQRAIEKNKAKGQ